MKAAEILAEKVKLIAQEEKQERIVFLSVFQKWEPSEGIHFPPVEIHAWCCVNLASRRAQLGRNLLKTSIFPLNLLTRLIPSLHVLVAPSETLSPCG